MNQLKRMLKMHPARVLKKLCCFEEVYTIAYRKRKSRSLLGNDLLSFKAIPYNSDYWYADPILITARGVDYLFAECFDMRTQKGFIGCAAFDESGSPSGFQPVIEEAYHLSFPMVFEWAGKWYMIPESSDNRSINLYCCEGDMFHWQKIREFSVEKPLVDTVVLSCDEEAVELLSSAIHPEDPLLYQWQKLTLRKAGDTFALEENGVIDGCEPYTRWNRMAGKIANVDGTAILPTQESTETDYGINLYLNDFAGKDIQKLLGKKLTVKDITIEGMSDKQRIGIHSYAVSEQYEVVDIRYFRFSPKNRIRKIIHKLKQIGRN